MIGRIEGLTTTIILVVQIDLTGSQAQPGNKETMNLGTFTKNVLSLHGMRVRMSIGSDNGVCEPGSGMTESRLMQFVVDVARPSFVIGSLCHTLRQATWQTGRLRRPHDAACIVECRRTGLLPR